MITTRPIKSILFFFAWLCISSTAIAQSNSSIPDVEKVFLHTDREQYAIGESIWYKAYMVYAYTHTLFDNSKLLYVELISPDSKVVMRNVTKMDLGLGHGDMLLADSLGIEAGKYQLRAYTNWTRNFGDDFVFKKEVEIIDIRAKKNLDVESIADKSLLFDLQFFPEGGSLVEDVSCRVAFKAIYKNGEPCFISGKVRNSQNDQVAEIETKHDGMGSFVFTPVKGEEYVAEVIDATGRKVETILPQPLNKGYTLSVVGHKGKHIVTIKTNEETLKQNPGKPVTIRGTSRGITYMEGSQPLSGVNHTFVLPDNDFPEGIARITLFDAGLKPQSERLIFVEKQHDILIDMATDKEEYEPREKVDLKLSMTTNEGSALVGSFSLSVTDANISGEGLEGTNICSYFLMQSDIRGKVYKPGYYFNKANTRRLKDLDLLLLTQGWRDFLWKRLPVLKDTIEFELEQDIKISGHLRKLLVDAPLENTKINMILSHKGESLMVDEVTDEQGNFVFDNVMFMGSSKLMLSTQNKKGKNKGHLIMDSLYLPPLAVDFEIDTTMFSMGSLEGFKKKMLEKHITYQVPIGIDDKLLEEVVVRGSKVLGNEMNDAHTSIYGTPDFTYEVKEDGPRFSSIFQLLQFSIPGLVASGNSVVFNGRGAPLVLLDGGQIDMEVLGSVNADDVARIESLKNSAGGAVFGSQGANGVINIYTKTGSAGTRKKVYHSVNREIQGYYDARVFYSPNYENETAPDDKADIRNTLYWNPYIQLDQEGAQQVEYFNSDVNTTVNVVLQGITDSGIPLVVKSQYEIKKQLTE